MCMMSPFEPVEELRLSMSLYQPTSTGSWDIALGIDSLPSYRQKLSRQALEAGDGWRLLEECIPKLYSERSETV